MARVKNKVCIVTGGSLGIGKSACVLLAREGAKIAVTDIKDKEGQEVVGEITAEGGTAKYWHHNVSSESETKDVLADIKQYFNRIDVLVNNAGISGTKKPTDQVSEDEWDRVMAVNVKGVFFCTKHVIPYLKEAGGGSIINLSSIYGIIGAPDVPPYHASKGAVRLMTKTDALLYAKDNIRVNSIHPGFIWTPMVEEYSKSTEGGVDKTMEYLNSIHPLGHLGEPDDVGYGIVYLASDESKFITGSELVIDGGYTAR